MQKYQTVDYIFKKVLKNTKSRSTYVLKHHILYTLFYLVIYLFYFFMHIVNFWFYLKACYLQKEFQVVIVTIIVILKTSL